MRKAVILLAVLAAVMTAGISFGAIRDFGAFSLDIPKGWTAVLQDNPNDMTVDIVKNDKRSSMSVTYAFTEGYAIEDLVADWAHMEEDASEPELMNDGYYMFTFRNDDGKKSTCYVKGLNDGRMYLYVEMTGRDAKEMKAIMDSFQTK